MGRRKNHKEHIVKFENGSFLLRNRPHAGDVQMTKEEVNSDYTIQWRTRDQCEGMITLTYQQEHHENIDFSNSKVTSPQKGTYPKEKEISPYVG